MGDSYIVRVSSQKGGVGKTVISTNLAVILKSKNYDVLLIDADTSNPTVAACLGLGSYDTGYKEVVESGVELGNELSSYGSIGLNIIPGTLAIPQYKPTPKKIAEFYRKVKKENYDVVIVDTAPGSFSDLEARFFNEAIIVTLPDIASAKGNSNLAMVYEKYHIRHRLVINRVAGDSFEMTQNDIEKVYGDVAYAALPEDPIIKQSLSKHVPAYLLNQNSKFSIAAEQLSRAYQLRLGTPEAEQKNKPGFGRRIRRLFGM